MNPRIIVNKKNIRLYFAITNVGIFGYGRNTDGSH